MENLIKDVKSFFNYSWLLQQLIIKDLKIKYKRSVLGYFWSILNPLLTMIILTIVFSNMFRFNVPNYPVYLLIGHLVFNFYAESTSVASQSIVWGAGLIRKVYLPKYIFPISRVLSCFVTTVLALVALFVMLVVAGIPFRLPLIELPLVLVYVLFFSIGVGLIMSTSVVFFRDTEYLYNVFLTAFNYLTPIFYPVDLLPLWLRNLMVFNPLYNFIAMFRKIALYGQWPTIQDHLICFAFAVVSMALGIYVFHKNQNDFILYI